MYSFPLIFISIIAPALVLGIFVKWYLGVIAFFVMHLLFHLDRFGNAEGWSKSFVYSRVKMFQIIVAQKPNADPDEWWLYLIEGTMKPGLASNSFLATVKSGMREAGADKITLDSLLITICIADWQRWKKRPATADELQIFNRAIQNGIASASSSAER